MAIADDSTAPAAAGDGRDVACFIDRANDDYEMCDLADAIETDVPYQSSTSRVRRISRR